MRVPIIALTAWGNVDLAVSAMKHGASDFIEKPWRNDSLLEKVRIADAARPAGPLIAAHLRSRTRGCTAITDTDRARRHVLADGIELFGESIPAVLWEETTSAYGSQHLTRSTSASPMYPAKERPGALIAAMLYASVSTLSASSNSPDLILGNVETILRNQLGEGHYVTIFYGVFDLKTRVLNFVNAGHCPPILRHADGSIEILSSTRPVLGLMLDTGFRSERLRLSAGDRLLLYTDGVTEATNEAGEEFGPTALHRCWKVSPMRPLSEQYGNIMESVRSHSGGQAWRRCHPPANIRI